MDQTNGQWRGMEVPAEYRHAFLNWSNDSQKELELEPDVALEILSLTSEASRDCHWYLAKGVALEGRMLRLDDCLPSGIPNKRGFPHWNGLLPHQQKKANGLGLSETDFRDYDPVAIRARNGEGSGQEYVYTHARVAVHDVLSHQQRLEDNTVLARFLARTRAIPGFWGGAVFAFVAIMVFRWVWNAICLVQPEGLSAHELEVQNIVNPYYYSSRAQWGIGMFWGSVIFGGVAFVVGMWFWAEANLDCFGRSVWTGKDGFFANLWRRIGR